MDDQGYPRETRGPKVYPHLIFPTLTHPNQGLEVGRGTQRQSLPSLPIATRSM